MKIEWGTHYKTISAVKMLCRRESPRRGFTPVLAPGREFHSGTKSRRLENQVLKQSKQRALEHGVRNLSQIKLK